MSELIVLVFDTESGAQEMLDAVGQLQKQRLITLEDAAIVIRNLDDDVGVWQANSLVGRGSLGRGFWRGLIRRAFPMSSVGHAAGATEEASVDDLPDASVSDFIKGLGEAIQPGNSGLLLLVADSAQDVVIEELKKNSIMLLRVPISLPTSTLRGIDDAPFEEEDAPFEEGDAPFEGSDSLSGDEDFNGW